jgi:hypothetical protein
MRSSVWITTPSVGKQPFLIQELKFIKHKRG